MQVIFIIFNLKVRFSKILEEKVKNLEEEKNFYFYELKKSKEWTDQLKSQQEVLELGNISLFKNIS